MSQLRAGAAWTAFAAFAILLVVGAPAMGWVLAEDVTGKVTAYAKGKSITIEVEGEKMEIKVSKETKIEGKVAVDKVVTVTVEDGAATKIVVKEE